MEVEERQHDDHDELRSLPPLELLPQQDHQHDTDDERAELLGLTDAGHVQEPPELVRAGEGDRSTVVAERERDEQTGDQEVREEHDDHAGADTPAGLLGPVVDEHDRRREQQTGEADAAVQRPERRVATEVDVGGRGDRVETGTHALVLLSVGGRMPRVGSAAAVATAGPADADVQQAEHHDAEDHPANGDPVTGLGGDVAREGLCTDGETRHARVPSVRSCRVGCYLPLPVVPASAAREPQNADDRQAQENPGYPVGSVQRERSGACERLARLSDDHALLLLAAERDQQPEADQNDRTEGDVVHAEVLVAGRVRQELERCACDVHDAASYDPLFRPRPLKKTR